MVKVHRETPYVPPPRRGPAPGKIALGAGALVLLGALIAAGVVILGGNAAAPTPNGAVTTSEPTPTPRGSDVLPLPRGGVIAGGGGSRHLYGVALGYPHLPSGGVNAAYNLFGALANEAMALPGSRQRLQRAIYAPGYSGQYRVTAAEAAHARQRFHLNAAGEVVHPDGTVAQQATFVSKPLLRYGAYRVHRATRNRAVVDVWIPQIVGIMRGGRFTTETGGLQVLSARVTTVWTQGDWQIAGLEARASFVQQDIHLPGPAASFERRAALLGPGWVVPRNATESPTAWRPQ